MYMKRAITVITALLMLSACGATSPKPAKVTPTPPQNITIAFGGDTNGVEHISNYLNTGGDPFSDVAPLLSKADISVINLESAVTNQTEHQVKQYFFNSNPLLLDKLAAAGVDVINIGNNHAGDYLRPGVSETIKAIEDRKMLMIGGGNSGREAWTAKVIDVRGTKVAFLGIAKVNGGFNTVASGELAGTTDGWNQQVIELAIKAAARQAKVVIIYVHWGVEGQSCPQAKDIKDAKQWLEWGATAIIGSHSHRQQPVVRYGTKIVDYSLGNFSFYVRNGDGLQSGVGYLTVTPQGEVTKYAFYPALINPDSGAPILLRGKQKEEAIKNKQSVCKSLSNQD